MRGDLLRLSARAASPSAGGALLVLALVLGGAVGAAAQDPPVDAGAPDAARPPPPPTVICPPLSGVEATYPADGATGVPRNTSVRVRYGPAARMSGVELVTLRDARDVLVGGTVTSDVHELVFTPNAPLEPGIYRAAAPALDGGESTLLAFTVEDTLDESAPTLGAPTAGAWDLVGIEEICDVPSGDRYSFRLAPGELADDRGVEHLELRVFRVGEPGTPALEVQRVPAREAIDGISVLLPQNQAVGHVCFALAARDLASHIGVGSAQACFETIAPPFWDGCSVRARTGRRAPRPALPPLALLALATLAALRRGARARRALRVRLDPRTE